MLSVNDPTREALELLIVEMEEECKNRELCSLGATFLVAADGCFLGRITDPKHEESLLNPRSKWGNRHSRLCIFNPDSPYASRGGEFSLNNPNSTKPPKLVVKGGKGEGWICLVTRNRDLAGENFETSRFFEDLKKDYHQVEEGKKLPSGGTQVPAYQY